MVRINRLVIYVVAFMVCSLLLSIKLLSFSQSDLRRMRIGDFIKRYQSRQIPTYRNMSILNEKEMVPRTESNQTTTKPKRYDVAKTQKRRKRTLKEACMELGANMTFDPTKDLVQSQLSGLDYIFVIPQFKILYCYIPKVGCTSWKETILELTGFDRILRARAHPPGWSLRKSLHEVMPRFFRTMSSLGLDEAKEVLANYTSFAFVRNPYTRLLSAYRDKFTIDGHSKWNNEMLEWMVQNDPVAAADVFTGTRKFTFPEFIRYYLSPVENNPHWREYYRLCWPCIINYDFIGHYETIQADSQYVLRRLFHEAHSAGLPEPVRVTNSSTDAVLRTFYSEVPREVLQRLSKHGGVTIDSELFGYDIPDIIKELLEGD